MLGRNRVVGHRLYRETRPPLTFARIARDERLSIASEYHSQVFAQFQFEIPVIKTLNWHLAGYPGRVSGVGGDGQGKGAGVRQGSDVSLHRERESGAIEGTNCIVVR
jgi:hypothetical protein